MGFDGAGEAGIKLSNLALGASEDRSYSVNSADSSNVLK
jgi:hypothetical protein